MTQEMNKSCVWEARMDVLLLWLLGNKDDGRSTQLVDTARLRTTLPILIHSALGTFPQFSRDRLCSLWSSVSCAAPLYLGLDDTSIAEPTFNVGL